MKNINHTEVEEIERTCSSCKKTKVEVEFIWSSQLGRHSNVCKACNRQKCASFYKRNKGYFKSYEQSDDYKMKRSARNKIKNAIARGVVKRQPCEVCDTPNAEAHHEDYELPFDVAWLCREHHAEQHRSITQ